MELIDYLILTLLTAFFISNYRYRKTRTSFEIKGDVPNTIEVVYVEHLEDDELKDVTIKNEFIQ